MRASVIAIVTAALLAACGLGDAPTLDGSEWLSVDRTRGDERWPLVAGTQVRLSFTDGQLGASAGCNSIGGTYRIEGGRLRFEGGGMTEMGCDEERHAQDDWLAGYLGSNPMISIGDSDMTLASGDEVVVLRDRGVADPDLPLTGTTWTVDTLMSGDAASTVPAGAVATLTFADDGSVEIASGCNEGTGRYEVAEGVLSIGDVILTDMACDGPAAQLEAFVLDVLTRGGMRVEIKAASLRLAGDGRGLGLRGS